MYGGLAVFAEAIVTGGAVHVVAEDEQGIGFQRPLLPATFTFQRFERFDIVAGHPTEAFKVDGVAGHVADKEGMVTVTFKADAHVGRGVTARDMAGDAGADFGVAFKEA